MADKNELYEKQHAKGKLHAIERLEKLFDEGKYQELTEESKRDGVICATGKVAGKQVVVAAQDFTCKGGSLGLQQGTNIAEAQDFAFKKKCPFIMINDSGGARIQEGVDALAGYGEIFYRNVRASGVIPQISVITGPCAGGAVYSPGITDFIFMVKNIGQMYITGPKVIKQVTGEDITAEALGGYTAHMEKSGVSHFGYYDEESCIKSVRYLISILPSNNRQKMLIMDKDAYKKAMPFDFELPEGDNAPYDMHKLIENIFDDDSFMEVQPFFATEIIVGFAKLYGMTVGVVANDPSSFAGVLNCDTSDKAARFVRFCDAFNIPVISLTDVPGYMPGSDQEYKGIIRHGAKLLYAFAEATVPKINVIVRKAFGGAYIAMNSKHLGSDVVLAWPSAQIAVMGEAGAVEILYAKQIKAMPEEDRAAFIKDKQEEYRKNVVGYKFAMDREYVNEVIKPKETREKLYQAMMDCRRIKNLKHVRPIRKHGNIPL